MLLDHSAALCVVFDSIFGDVRLDRVKFNANADYQYISNFKELQSQLTPPKLEPCPAAMKDEP